MQEDKIQNSAARVRSKYLIDWGVTIETAGTIEVMQELLSRTSFDKDDKNNVCQSLLIGILQKYNQTFKGLTEEQIKGLIQDGFQTRMERKRKRLKTGIITRNTFEAEFPNGAEIFAWLLENKILKHISRTKGYMQGLAESHRVLIKLAYPDTWARILAVLDIAQKDSKEKTEYYYQNPEVYVPWRSP